MFEYLNFQKLPVWSQAEVLAAKGNLLAKRHHLDYTVSLYYLDNYFVEVWAKGGLQLSTSFRKTTQALTILEPYLDEVSVKAALEN